MVLQLMAVPGSLTSARTTCSEAALIASESGGAEQRLALTIPAQLEGSATLVFACSQFSNGLTDFLYAGSPDPAQSCRVGSRGLQFPPFIIGYSSFDVPFIIGHSVLDIGYSSFNFRRVGSHGLQISLGTSLFLAHISSFSAADPLPEELFIRRI